MLKPKVGKIKYTIVHLLGNGGSILSQHEPMKKLLDKGFQVFVFDYSGYGFSGGVAKRTNLIDDGIGAIEYVKSRTDIMNTKLIIYGQSYGGNLAICVAEKKQNDIDGLVIEGAFTNHKSLAASAAKNGFVRMMARIFVKEIYSGTKAIGNVKKPILIIHSNEDKVIPFSMGKILFDKANEPKQFYEIKGKHLYELYNNADSIAYKIKSMVDF